MIGYQPQDIVSFLEELLCHEKARSRVWSIGPLTTTLNVTLELIWIRDLSTEIDFPSECPMKPYGDNKTAIHIVENAMFHERTKHIKVDCHIVRKKLEEKIVMAKHVSEHQLPDLLTKLLGRIMIDFI